MEVVLVAATTLMRGRELPGLKPCAHMQSHLAPLGNSFLPALLSLDTVCTPNIIQVLLSVQFPQICTMILFRHRTFQVIIYCFRQFVKKMFTMSYLSILMLFILFYFFELFISL